MIGAVVKRAREGASLQQRDVADRAGLQMSRISRIENGRVEADKEEVVAILRAIGTVDSNELADELERPLRHVTAPSWGELGSEDRRALRDADDALDTLKKFTSRPDFPQHLRQLTDDLAERLATSALLLGKNDYTVSFIGSIGVGKSTAINSLFNLTGEFRKPRRNAKSGFRTTFGLLPTGSGRTTAFEYRIVHGAEVAIRIDPEEDDKILRDVHSLCEYWYERTAHGRLDLERTISEEAEKVYRNMAGLTEIDEEDDRLVALIKPGFRIEDLAFEFRQRLNLPGRTRTELFFRADREGSETEGEWIQRRLRQLNFGLVKDCPLPRQLTLALPNPQLKTDGGVRFTIVDTRGIYDTIRRREFIEQADDRSTIRVLCTGFGDAPNEHVKQLIENARTSAPPRLKAANDGGNQLWVSDALTGKRTMILVLARHDDAANTSLPGGERAGSKEAGYRQRQREVHRAIGEAAQDVEVLFFNSMADEERGVTREKLLSQINVVRGVERSKIRSTSDAVVALLNKQNEANFAETRRKVREKIHQFIDRYANVPLLPRPTYTRLVTDLRRGLHASSVWSVTRNEGYGRSVNLYEVFSSLVREDTSARTLAVLHGLEERLNELLEAPDMKRTDMRRSRRYVVEILTNASPKHLEFLKHSAAIGEATLQAYMQADWPFWRDCLAEWGRGAGYLERVATHFESWIDQRPEFTGKLDEHIQQSWDERFIGWLEGYAMDDVPKGRRSPSTRASGSSVLKGAPAGT